MAETLASMFWRRVGETPDRPAQLVKKAGEWRRLTWAEVGTAVREAALGLLGLGVQRGDRVALLAASRAEWVHADLAVLSVGAVTVPIYASYTAEQIADLVEESGAGVLIVDTPELLARALAARDRMPGLVHLVLLEGKHGEPGVVAWDELRRRGRTHAAERDGVLAARLAACREDDLATIVYTSGTTGEPKGVMQTHGNHLASLRAIAQIPGADPGDVHLLFLPLAHSFARLEAFMGIHRGLVTAFAEALDRLADNLREVRPDFIFGVPRVFEKAQARIESAAAAAHPARRWLFAWAMGVGARASALERARRPLPPSLRLARRLADRAVLQRLRQAFGGRLRFAVSGGAPLAVETAEFFHAAGLLIVEGYGLTEACPALTFNRLDRFKFGSVGQAIPGVELRLAPDGEILARGPNIATRGYWRRPEATAETFTPDGWLRTGDIGRLDDEGFLYVTDRKKELIVTAGGLNVAPQPIEAQLRRDPLIAQAVVYGDRRPYPAALITLDPGELARFARQEGLLVVEHALLARHPSVEARVWRTVHATNERLPSYARIRKLAILPGHLTEEGGELTPTQKVRRKVVAERYRAVLDSLYR